MGHLYFYRNMPNIPGQLLIDKQASEGRLSPPPERVELERIRSITFIATEPISMKWKPKFTVYNMEIETEISISGVLTETRTMNSAKRYNEFRELHKELQSYGIITEAFPPKKIGPDATVIEERKKIFQQYMNHLIPKCKEPQSRVNDILLNFFSTTTLASPNEQ